MLEIYVYLRARLTRLLNCDDRGATAVEYVIVLSLIAGVIFGAVALLGTSVSSLFGKAVSSFPAA